MSEEAMSMQRVHEALMRGDKHKHKTKKRYACVCGHKLTSNQIKAKGGFCSHCGREVGRTL